MKGEEIEEEKVELKERMEESGPWLWIRERNINVKIAFYAIILLYC